MAGYERGVWRREKGTPTQTQMLLVHDRGAAYCCGTGMLLLLKDWDTVAVRFRMATTNAVRFRMATTNTHRWTFHVAGSSTPVEGS